MTSPMDVFREAVDRFAQQWCNTGVPSRQVLDDAAASLVRLKTELAISGLWRHAPIMLTATMDDGLGQGLAVIENVARAIGLQVIALGLLKSPQEIVDACREHHPDFLGLTILHDDTEDDLRTVAENIPSETRIVAGGPAFLGDPAFAGRTGTHYAARHAADFLRYMLNVSR
jgi:methylmalonyl-CoA mutase cobalamin-binding subunit